MANPEYSLTVTAGPDKGKQITLVHGRSYKIGCDAKEPGADGSTSGDDLVLTDPMVLKGHCSITIGDHPSEPYGQRRYFFG